MKLNELKPRQGKVEVEVTVVSVSEVRGFNKNGSSGRVATAMVKDDSGEMKMSLWNDDIEKVKPGLKIKITNGYVNEFQGEMQLSAGKFGNIEIIS